MFLRFWFLLLPGLSTCSGDFRELEDLGPLRILALQATNPELTPGASTNITPLVSYVDQKPGETLVHSAVGCADPGLALGAEPKCTNATVLLAPTALTWASAGRTGAFTNLFSVSIPNDFLSGIVSPSRDFLVIYRVESSLGTQTQALKRIRVSTAAQPNHNPQILELNQDSSPLTAIPQSNVALAPDLPETSFEVRDGNQESLLVSWTSSAGAFESSRTLGRAPNLFTPPQSGSSPFVLVVIVRDLEGGLTFLVREF